MFARTGAYLLLLLCALPASAQTMKLVKTLPVPGGARGLHTLQPDRYVQVGAAQRVPAGKPVPTHLVFPVLDAKEGTLISLKAPLSRFLTEHGAAFQRGKAVTTYPKGNQSLDVNFELVHYDPAAGVAGLLLYDYTSQVSYRFYFVTWDLKADRLGKPVPLTAAGKSMVHPIAAGKSAFYYVVERPDAGARAVTVAGIEVATGKSVFKHEFSAPLRTQPLAGSFYLTTSPEAGLIGLAEYSQKSYGALTPPATGFVIDRAKDTDVSFPVPISPYGLAFTPDGKQLVIASSELGQLVQVDLATKKRSAPTKIGKGIQRLCIAGKTIFLFYGPTSKSIDTLTWPALKPKKLPVAKAIAAAKTLNSEESALLDQGRRIVISDGDGQKVYLVDLGD